METMIYEIKKMFHHQKGLVIVFLFVVLSICVLLVSDKPTSLAVEDSRDQYMKYIDQVQGSLSEGTEQFLSSESNRISEAQIAIDKLYGSYYNGALSENEFTIERNRLESILANRSGFELVYEQYIYVRENPENRSFLYRNGWDGLLSNDSLDFLLVLTILLLITPVFCHEFESSMDSLSLTMRKGGKSEVVCKVFLVLLVVLIFSLLSIGLRYLYFDMKYGLENGSFPLQSLSYFSTATKDISLLGTFFCVSLIKTLGYLSFAVVVLFLSVCIKKYALTLFASTALIVVPYLGLGASFAKYTLSGPLGLMLGTGYFRGSVFQTDRFTDEVMQIFREIPTNTVLVIISIIVSVSLVMICAIVRLRSNIWSLSKTPKRHRAISFLLITCIAMACFTGCSSNANEQCSTAYNSRFSMSYENEQYRFYVDESDLDNRRLVFEDRETGEIHDLVRTPLLSSFRVALTIYGNGSYVYYIRHSLNKSEFREYIDWFAIVEVDTRTFSERIIYERNIDFNRELLMGAVSLNNDDLLFLHVADTFFIDTDNNKAFFIADDVYQVDFHNGKVTTLNIPTNSNIAFDGERIYYIGSRYQLSYYDIETREYGVIPDLITTRFFLTENEILYLNRVDQNKIYAINLETSISTKVIDKTALDFHGDANFIYYQDAGDLQDYTIARN